MVEAVKSVSNVQYINKQNEIKKLIKYTNGEALKDVPDTFSSTVKSATGSAAIFEGIPLFNLLRRNKKLSKKFISEPMTDLGAKNEKALKELMHGDNKIFKKISEYMKSTKNAKNKFSEIKSTTKEIYSNEHPGLIKKIKGSVKKLTGKIFKSAGKEAAKETTEIAVKETAETAVKEATNGIFSKLGKTKLGKFMKSSGAGFMLVFSGIGECLSEVIPTFKELGKEKGIKQLGKSTVKVVGDTVGFIGGESIFTSVGTAIGTAICPGLGTAIGAVVGFVGGFLGSFVMGKVTKAITGKSEREIAKEKNEKKQVRKLVSDKAAIEELKNNAKLKIQEEYNTYGKLSEDSQIALESIQNLEKTNPFTTANV